jgi:two-component system chemotaxis response regulator CheY
MENNTMGSILIIDDSEAVRAQLKAALVAGGFEVEEAGDGNEGFLKLTSLTDISLVISDFNMPGMDGITMLQKAKEKLGAFKFPVFVLTTETSDSLKTSGKALGVMAWINKPFVAEKLVDAAKKVTAKKAA